MFENNSIVDSCYHNNASRNQRGFYHQRLCHPTTRPDLYSAYCTRPVTSYSYNCCYYYPIKQNRCY